jgi:aspartokinase-like uncharacterized kinase
VAPGLGILAVPGGGRAADRIRLRHLRGELDVTEAHWAAIRALDGNALRLAGGCGAELPVVTSPGRWPGPARSSSGAGRDPYAARGAGGRLAVLAPSPLLQAEDPLPHGWEVTSDSIAAWVAGQCGASRLVLLKARGDRSPSDPDGRAFRLSARRAADRGLVDRHLSRLLRTAAFRTWIVNGRHPDRLLAFLTGDGTAGTPLLP